MIALAAWGAGAVAALVLLLPICDMHFDCGCTWPWKGAAERCDIHVAGPPDCPWCTDPRGIAAALGGTSLLTLAGALLLGPGRPWTVAAATFLASVGAALAAGWLR